MSSFVGDVEFALPVGYPAKAAQLVSLLGQVCPILNAYFLKGVCQTIPLCVRNSPLYLHPCVAERWQLHVISIGGRIVS